MTRATARTAVPRALRASMLHQPMIGKEDSVAASIFETRKPGPFVKVSKGNQTGQIKIGRFLCELPPKMTTNCASEKIRVPCPRKKQQARKTSKRDAWACRVVDVPPHSHAHARRV